MEQVTISCKLFIILILLSFCTCYLLCALIVQCFGKLVLKIYNQYKEKKYREKESNRGQRWTFAYDDAIDDQTLIHDMTISYTPSFEIVYKRGTTQEQKEELVRSITEYVRKEFPGVTINFRLREEVEDEDN